MPWQYFLIGLLLHVKVWLRSLEGFFALCLLGLAAQLVELLLLILLLSWWFLMSWRLLLLSWRLPSGPKTIVMLLVLESLNDLRIQILKAVWTLVSFLVLIYSGTSSLFGFWRQIILILAKLRSVPRDSYLLWINLGNHRSIIGLFDHVEVLRFDKRLVGVPAIVCISIIISRIWLVRVSSLCRSLIRGIEILFARVAQKLIEQWVLTLLLARIETWSLGWVQRLPYQGDVGTRFHGIPFMGSFVRDIVDEFVAVSTQLVTLIFSAVFFSTHHEHLLGWTVPAFYCGCFIEIEASHAPLFEIILHFYYLNI